MIKTSVLFIGAISLPGCDIHIVPPATGTVRDSPRLITNTHTRIADDRHGWSSPPKVVPDGEYVSLPAGVDQNYGRYEQRRYPVVIFVGSGSIAEKAGIAVGDLLVQYHGIDLSEQNEDRDVLSWALRESVQRGIRVTEMLLVRNGKPFETTVPAGMRIGARFRCVKQRS